MQQVPADIWAAFERRLDQAQVPADQRPDCHKWVRFYFDFCHKYGHSPAAPTSLGPFLTKLASRNQSVTECVGLRVQCFNLDAMLLTVHDGKGQKDRTVPLPARALPDIREQMDRVRRLHAEDLAAGYAGVFLPRQLEKKYRNAAKEFIWQWFFPAANLTWIAPVRERRRYHLHDSHVQGAVKQAAAQASIPKRVSPHTFRHTFASHLLLANYDLQTIQRLLGHSDIKTTMIYLQTVPSVTLREAKSPLDCL
jgi:site-specific recombinase XerD